MGLLRPCAAQMTQGPLCRLSSECSRVCHFWTGVNAVSLPTMPAFGARPVVGIGVPVVHVQTGLQTTETDMPHFLFAYHGGKMPETQQETEAEIASWQGWFDSISASIVDPGNPVGESRTVSDGGVVDDGGLNPLSGYTIVIADDIDEAVQMASRCPILGHGSVEVAEIHEVTL